jgi:tetratricopeptide (TPR) repeat protein
MRAVSTRLERARDAHGSRTFREGGLSSKDETRAPDLQKLEDKLRKDPKSKLFFPLAEEYAKLGRLDHAINLLRTGMKAHPDFLGARVALGKVLLSKGQTADAKKEFEQVIAANPDNLMAHKKLAAIYLKEGEKDKALASCELILAVNRTDAEVLRLKEEIDRLPDFVDGNEATVVAQVLPSTEESTAPNMEPNAGDMTVVEPLLESTMVVEAPPVEPDVAEATEIMALPVEQSAHGEEPNAGDMTVVEPLLESTVVMEAPVVEPDIAEATEVMALPVEPPVGPAALDETTTRVAEAPADDDLATMSLADLYVAQGHYDEGIAIYRQLLGRTPADSEIAAKLDNALTLARLLAPTPVDADEVKSEVVSHVLSGSDELGIGASDAVVQPSVVGAVDGASRHQAAIHRLELWLARIAERRHR